MSQQPTSSYFLAELATQEGSTSRFLVEDDAMRPLEKVMAALAKAAATSEAAAELISLAKARITEVTPQDVLNIESLKASDSLDDFRRKVYDSAMPEHIKAWHISQR
jgi:hypothetical protein